MKEVSYKIFQARPINCLFGVLDDIVDKGEYNDGLIYEWAKSVYRGACEPGHKCIPPSDDYTEWYRAGKKEDCDVCKEEVKSDEMV